MFQRNNDSNNGGKEPPQKKSPPTIISNDIHMLGNIISEGTLDVDGHIDGNIKCRSITIRKNGVIKGDVIADAIQVYGKVEGVLKAKEVNLYASCHVEGVIIHETLTIEDGAFVDGQFKRSTRIDMTELELLGDSSHDAEDEDDVFRRLKLIS